jgi:acyl-CoA thioesterase-1
MCAAMPARAEPLTIVAFGDSLTAGYLLPPDKSFPAQLEKALKAKGHDVRVENAGVSGDTATDGLERLEWALPANADAVILQLGANDALRGVSPAVTEKALDGILAKVKARSLPVLIAGMEAPRNMGREYADAFRAMYPRLQAKYDALLYPFFLDGVAMNRVLNLADGIHPTAEGVALIVKNITPHVEALIVRAQARKTRS